LPELSSGDVERFTVRDTPSTRASNDNASHPDEVDAMFPHGASPFRTVDNAPPKLWSRHVWGMEKWGKRAGAWGKGVEGLKERKKEKDEMPDKS